MCIQCKGCGVIYAKAPFPYLTLVCATMAMEGNLCCSVMYTIVHTHTHAYKHTNTTHAHIHNSHMLCTCTHIQLRKCTHTGDEVREMLEGLCGVVKAEVDSELINFAHTHAILLRQLFQTADRWHLNLEANISELENRCVCVINCVSENLKTNMSRMQSVN